MSNAENELIIFVTPIIVREERETFYRVPDVMKGKFSRLFVVFADCPVLVSRLTDHLYRSI
jgi:hypothetical protein